MNIRIVVLAALVAASTITGCRGTSSSNEGDTLSTTTSTGSAGTAGTTAPASTPDTSTAPAPTGTIIAVSDSANGRTGIMGEVRKSPLTKGLPEGEKDYAPLAGARISVEDMSEKVVATVVSDANGKFFVPLPPGMHLLIPEPFEAVYPAPPVSQNVPVPNEGTASVTFTYDTGIDDAGK